MSLTNEQQRVIDAVMSTGDNRIIAVNSVAGSGKTSTADAIIQTYKPKQGFYTAFNKAIVTDSAKRFGKLINAKTIHSLAYKYVNTSRRTPEELNYLTIKENYLSYEEKGLIISILDDFFRSSSSNIEEYAESRTDDPVIQELIVEYANKMLDGEIPPSFNYMLKCLHLMLLNKQIQIDFDLFILDECQDTTAVTLEIFKLINADRKIMLGDTYQNIYSFMNTVNAFEELDNLNLLKLTKSFRCNEYIADIVEQFGRSYLDYDFSYSGNSEIKPENELKIAYITRTNAMLIERMFDLLQKNQSFTLTRDIKDIFALPISLLNASRGKQVFDKKYKYLEKEYQNFANDRHYPHSYFNYIIDITEDPLLESVTKMLLNFSQKRIDIFKIREKVTDLKPNPNIILTTAHAFKGLECDNVFIEEDLNNSVNRTINKIKELKEYLISNRLTLDIKSLLTKDQKEDLNTYYVALSRAKTNLMNVTYIG